MKHSQMLWGLRILTDMLDESSEKQYPMFEQSEDLVPALDLETLRKTRRRHRNLDRECSCFP